MIVSVVVLIFWVAPILTCWHLAEKDGKDPLGPILGAVFFSWAGGLIIWSLIKPNPDRVSELNQIEDEKDQDYIAKKRQSQQIDPKRKAELEKLLVVPKEKSEG